MPDWYSNLKSIAITRKFSKSQNILRYGRKLGPQEISPFVTKDFFISLTLFKFGPGLKKLRTHYMLKQKRVLKIRIPSKTPQYSFLPLPSSLTRDTPSPTFINRCRF